MGRDGKVHLRAAVRLAYQIEELKPYIRDTKIELEKAYATGKRIMLEGTQGLISASITVLLRRTSLILSSMMGRTQRSRRARQPPQGASEKPVEKPLSEPSVGVDAARAEKAQCFSRIVLGEGDSCSHVISADLGRAQIVHQRQDRGKASGMLGQLVCQSAHWLQSTIWRDGPLDVIG
jgi:hypothetical protein